MNDLLLVTLSITGLFAIYWVLWGQWKHNKAMRDAEINSLKEDQQERKD